MRSMIWILLFLPMFCHGQKNYAGEEYAWKSLRFGQTEKEYKAVVKKDLAIIDGHRFAVAADYNSLGRLTAIGLVGEDFMSLDADMFTEIYLSLLVYFAEIYGEGTRLNKFPEAEDISKGSTIEILRWMRGKKRITIGVWRDGDDRYYPTAYITNQQILE